MKENPRFLPIVSTHRILFHFLILFHDFEGWKMKQNTVGTVLHIAIFKELCDGVMCEAKLRTRAYRAADLKGTPENPP